MKSGKISNETLEQIKEKEKRKENKQKEEINLFEEIPSEIKNTQEMTAENNDNFNQILTNLQLSNNI